MGDATSAITGVAAGDFNRDGRGDLAVLTAPSGQAVALLTVYLGQTDGRMSAGWAKRFPISGNGDLKAADINSDGKLDLVVVQGSGLDSFVVRSATIFIGAGAGTFDLTGTTLTASGNQVMVADLDGDGRQDLIIGNSFFRTKADGTFDNPIQVPQPIAVADLNGDGIPDIVNNSSVNVIRPGGPAAILTAVYYGVGKGAFSNEASPLPYTSFYIATADFDRDGRVDIAEDTSGSRFYEGVSGNVAILSGGGTSWSNQTAIVAAAGADLLSADFNGDGIPDLFSGFSILLGKGDWMFYPPLWLSTPPYPRATPDACGATIGHVTVLDANGDGLPDVAYVFADSTNTQPSQLLLFLNAGTGDGVLAAAVQPLSSGFAARNAIVSLYGLGLTSATEAANSIPLPTTLGGIRLHINDQLASLLYVSPSQINYLMPDWQTDTGLQFYNPTLSIEHVGQPYIPKGISAPSVKEKPTFFTVNASGLPAAIAVRVAADGTQAFVPVYNCGQGACAAVPIDTSGDPVYVSLFATGLNNVTTANTAPSVQCSGGTVTYAGPQGQFPGLQQVNLRLDRAPIPGTPNMVKISCNETQNGQYAGYMSNVVQLQIR